MTQSKLQLRLDFVSIQVRRLRRWTGFAISGTILALISLLVWQIGSDSDARAWIVGTLLGIGALSLVATIFIAGVGLSNYRKLAIRVERKFPALDSRLLSALQVEEKGPASEQGYVANRLVQQTLAHGTTNSWSDVVSAQSIWLARIVSVSSWLAVSVLLMLFVTAPLERQTLSSTSASTSDVSASTSLLNVEPGNVSIERGTNLIVSAEYSGNLPREATLILEQEDGTESRVGMNHRFEDPVFDARVTEIDQPLRYRVELAGQQSESYRVEVFEYPRLIQANAILEYPDYLELPPKVVKNFRRVSAIEGTRVRLQFTFNKQISSAQLQTERAEPLVFSSVSPEENLYETEFLLEESNGFRLQLVDEEGRTNQDPELFTFTALVNTPPEIEVLLPARDVSVSALEELLTKAKFRDDFQLSDYGIAYQLQGQPNERSLLQPTKGTSTKNKRATAEHWFYFEELEVQPRDVVSYYFWAEDFDSAGSIRRSYSDMYFVEIRPFDEIFRQGQAQPDSPNQQSQSGQGQGEQGEQAAELLELQKQIINATWNVIRRETRRQVSPSFSDDVNLIRTSQSEALELFEEARENVTDDALKMTLDKITLKMQEAQLSLSKSMLELDVSQLQTALAAERLAFEGLLKLQVAESEVQQRQQQQQSQSQSSQSNSQRQAQLDQLQLEDQQNRYAEQSQAEEDEEQQAERETRQILSRLRDLAQRQSDLNEQLQELQTELLEAETEEERREVERKLERLREEQDEILRETEELADRTEQAENSEQMEQAQEQLEQARENINQASEALQDRKATQAAAAGARAESQFEDLRDEFQRQASGEFNRRIEDLSEKANELRQREREIAEKLSPQDEDGSPSLRNEAPPQLESEFREQREQLDEIMEDVRELVEDAEESEPLMAGTLYDAYRELEQQQVPEALEQAQQSYEAGLEAEAQELEQIAREGIEDFAGEIESAAQDILGDREEALRRAEQTLGELIDELNDERAAEQTAESGSSTDSSSDSGSSDEASDEDGARGRGSNESQEQQSRSESSQGQGQGQTEAGEQSRPSSGSGNQGSNSEEANRSSETPAESNSSDSNQTNPSEGGSTPQDTASQDSPSQNSGSQSSGSQGSGSQGSSSGNGRPDSNPNESETQQENPASQGEGQGSSSSGNQAQPSSSEGGLSQLFQTGGNDGSRPLTGDGYREWSDRMRDVEEMIDDPELRSEATKIRERVRDIRRDYRRQSKEPNWDVVNERVAIPLAQLQQKVREELLKRQTKESLVPIDRDPIPVDFEAEVGEYYKRLGREDSSQ